MSSPTVHAGAPPAARAVVAGGGILGTWHALELLRAGFAVDHLEAERAPMGASVRNFGLLWVSGRRDGEELEAALRARSHWEQVGCEVPGIGFRANGSLTVACSATERTVMQAFARHDAARARAIRFVEPEEVRACNPAIGGDIAGALACERDAAVEPRQALGSLRDHLTRVGRERYRFHPRRRVHGVASRALVDHRGVRWEADLAVVATGHTADHLPGGQDLASALGRVRLQMLETAPAALALTTSIADADSLRYYPAFDVAPLERLDPQSPVGAAHHLQLLVVQRLDGGLTIGDTHEYEEPFDFALSEQPVDELLRKATRILGAPLPPVRRRWDGVYAQCRDGRLCLREQIEDAVWVVTGAGGRGMTCAPAIAEDTLRAAGVEAARGPVESRR